MTDAGDKSRKYKDLTKNTLLFTLSNFGSKIITFLLVPLYTFVLSTDEYGMVDLVNTIVSLMVPILTINIQDAVLRYALDKETDARAVISLGINITIFSSALVAIVVFLISKFTYVEVSNTYLIFMFFLYFCTSLNNSLNMYLKAIEKVTILAIGGIIGTLAMCVGNILLLLVFEMGINGYLLATIGGQIIPSIIFFFGGKVYKDYQFVVNKEIVVKMLKYSAPLIASSIAWWVNNASDRYFITFYAGIAANGIYAIAYKIPTILTTIQSVFYNAWSISAIKEFDKEDRDGFLGNIYALYSILVTLCCLVLLLCNIPIAKILYSKEFFQAWQYVPFLLIGTVYNGIALFEGSIFAAIKKTSVVSKTTLLGAVVNIILNYFLIKYYGIQGAAVATAVGYAVTLGVRTLTLLKYVKINTKWGNHIICYVLLFIAGFFALKRELWYMQIVFIFLVVLIEWKYFKLLMDKTGRLIINKIQKK